MVSPAHARAGWKTRIDKLAAKHAMSISIANKGVTYYSLRRHKPRIPASNEKLLLSMTLLNRFSRNMRIKTTAGATVSAAGVIPGDLWILGHGDPTLAGSGPFAQQLSSFGATRLGRLAKRIKANGVKRIQGSVIGSTGYFAHDWWAPGWERDFPAEEVALPTALAFNGNSRDGRHISDPEKRAAVWLTKKLRQIGVKVAGRPQADNPPPPRQRPTVAAVRSAPLPKLLRFMNRNSSNFFAEMFGKRLSVETYDGWGTIAKGAAAIADFTRGHGATITAKDSSGLSYANRVSAAGITRLLRYAEDQKWGIVLRSTLPGPGEGTLEDRFAGVQVRAKTGTLDYVSSLSGWVWLQKSNQWGEFSILSHGLPKYRAVDIEDRIVRIVTKHAGPVSRNERPEVSLSDFEPVAVAWGWGNRPLV
jgi:D-alanyl-D-alanine carboxypeptidase